mgnify:CR=1 FL=1
MLQLDVITLNNTTKLLWNSPLTLFYCNYNVRLPQKAFGLNARLWCLYVTLYLFSQITRCNWQWPFALHKRTLPNELPTLHFLSHRSYLTSKDDNKMYISLLWHHHMLDFTRLLYIHVIILRLEHLDYA